MKKAAPVKKAAAQVPRQRRAPAPGPHPEKVPVQAPAVGTETGPAPQAARPAGPGDSPAASLRVREDEAPWTPEELAGVRAELEREVGQLRSEIADAEDGLVHLLRDSGEGAGDDQADNGSKTFEREQEISLANNARGMLQQAEHALERLANGTYGMCESCGNPIGKLRLQAFPRATLCLSCKSREERR